MNHLCKVNIVNIEQIVQVSEPNNEAQQNNTSVLSAMTETPL